MGENTNTKIDEVLDAILDQVELGTPRETTKANIKALFQQEQLALVDRIDKEVVGADEELVGDGVVDNSPILMRNIVRHEQRTHLNSIKEELNHG